MAPISSEVRRNAAAANDDLTAAPSGAARGRAAHGHAPGRGAHGDATPSGAVRDGVEVVIAMLRARGGRVTATRRATIEVLLAGGDHRHLSAEDVATEVRRRLPDVAESTIYRTLTALEELGVVTHVHLGHGPGTFHLAEAAHRHLVCRRCDSVIEVPAYEFVGLAQRLEQVYGFAMSSEHFAIVGQCRNCRADVTPGPL
jgi:Fur family transcriptional regulator, ferric uptake regulator